MAIWEKIINSIKDRFDQLTPKDKQRLVIICTAGFSVILTIAVIVSILGSSGEDLSDEPERLTINAPIPADELFLPDEPDFLPGVLLDREKRDVWTEDDALEFWQDPLRAGEEQWREKIETAIDELLERVP
ncbi:MAG: hypothetical protein LBU88_07270 [Treponema sp.]|jgi:hypothetical protein|nr:hypothetical protein [Treponema sp.]